MRILYKCIMYFLEFFLPVPHEPGIFKCRQVGRLLYFHSQRLGCSKVMRWLWFVETGHPSVRGGHRC